MDQEGHEGIIQPFMLNIPVSLWERDVLDEKTGLPQDRWTWEELVGSRKAHSFVYITPSRFGGPGLGFSLGPLKENSK